MMNLGGGDASGLRVANRRVHGSFRLGGSGDSDFHESPNPIVEWPSAVTLIS